MVLQPLVTLMQRDRLVPDVNLLTAHLLVEVLGRGR